MFVGKFESWSDPKYEIANEKEEHQQELEEKVEYSDIIKDLH